MRNGGAAARTDIDFTGPAGRVEAAHLLHRPGIPDVRQRPLADFAHGGAIQHVALAARVHISVLLDVHRPTPQVVARVLPIAGCVAGIGTHQVGFILLDTDLVYARHGLPEPDEVIHLRPIALHHHHLHHYLEPRAPLVFHAREADEIIAHLLELRALAVELEGLLPGAIEAQRDLFQRRIEDPAGAALVEKRAVGREQRRDAVTVAPLDALEDVRVHEGLAQADQHHVLGGVSGFANETFEDLVRHIGFGLRMGFTRAHGAVEIALGGGFDNVLDRQRPEPRPARQVTPQKLCPVPGPHAYIHCTCRVVEELLYLVP